MPPSLSSSSYLFAATEAFRGLSDESHLSLLDLVRRRRRRWVQTHSPPPHDDDVGNNNINNDGLWRCALPEKKEYYVFLLFSTHYSRGKRDERRIAIEIEKEREVNCLATTSNRQPSNVHCTEREERGGNICNFAPGELLCTAHVVKRGGRQTQRIDSAAVADCTEISLEGTRIAPNVWPRT